MIYSRSTLIALILAVTTAMTVRCSNIIKINKLDVGVGKVVGLDYYYNNEWKKNANGQLVQYHYTWEDTESTGYSQAGGIIKQLGAGLGESHNAPTLAALNKFSIYIIVDPDTPLETAHPHYIDSTAVKTITEWVANGGVLMIMENDKGNADIVHTNLLAEKFGIQFNEVSFNAFTGTNYDLGKFDNLPDQPIFNGVSAIFLKGITTMNLKQPAYAILSRNGNNFMAFARYGRGAVFAVGDPWFYNEYIGHKFLPAEFQNTKATENLFVWLLGMAKKVK